jgi:hypothetical protein
VRLYCCDDKFGEWDKQLETGKVKPQKVVLTASLPLLEGKKNKKTKNVQFI